MFLIYLLGVSLINVVIFLVGKYYFLSDLVRAKDDQSIKSKYHAFTRDDIDNMNVFWSFPFYSTFIIRIVLGWINSAACALICQTAVIGIADIRNLSPVRFNIVKWTV